MTVEEIKKAAHSNDRSNWEHMNVAEKLLWDECYMAYFAYKNNTMSEEACKEKMLTALKDYQINLSWYAAGIKAQHRIAEMFRDIEVTASEFRKEPDNLKAWNFMNRIYGVYEGMKDADDNEEQL